MRTRITSLNSKKGYDIKKGNHFPKIKEAFPVRFHHQFLPHQTLKIWKHFTLKQTEPKWKQISSPIHTMLIFFFGWRNDVDCSFFVSTYIIYILLICWCNGFVVFPFIFWVLVHFLFLAKQNRESVTLVVCQLIKGI